MNSHSFQTFFRRNSLRGHSLVQILIYINLGLFTLMVLHGTILGLQMQAILNPPTQLLVHWGAQFWPLVVQKNQWWRCLTYAYTHGGLMHIGFNMLVLYQIGPMIEEEIGWRRFFTLYTLCGLLATFAGYFWHPMVVVVGASGAIFGLIGFSVSYYHRMGGARAIQHRNFMFQWAVMAFVFGLVVGADNAAHLGGLLTGAAFGWMVPTSVRGQRGTEPLFKVLAWTCVVLTAISILAIPFSWA
ncbi:rhomboid family intramembrane serine protease [Geopsychrobacter electrodiphilus]|uniref:rhomboid family intramembrane serine protease n=1 Tax=Geopsychrobacter electrodiphilus TaxID=225196 RepID=UPI00036F08C3|nr:rhomboid family intramembrane serine protease [Geopsychrobacter electrodiphilus]